MSALIVATQFCRLKNMPFGKPQNVVLSRRFIHLKYAIQRNTQVAPAPALRHVCQA